MRCETLVNLEKDFDVPGEKDIVRKVLTIDLKILLRGGSPRQLRLLSNQYTGRKLLVTLVKPSSDSSRIEPSSYSSRV